MSTSKPFPRHSQDFHSCHGFELGTEQSTYRFWCASSSRRALPNLNAVVTCTTSRNLLVFVAFHVCGSGCSRGNTIAVLTGDRSGCAGTIEGMKWTIGDTSTKYRSHGTVMQPSIIDIGGNLDTWISLDTQETLLNHRHLHTGAACRLLTFKFQIDIA